MVEDDRVRIIPKLTVNDPTLFYISVVLIAFVEAGEIVYSLHKVHQNNQYYKAVSQEYIEWKGCVQKLVKASSKVKEDSSFFVGLIRNDCLNKILSLLLIALMKPSKKCIISKLLLSIWMSVRRFLQLSVT